MPNNQYNVHRVATPVQPQSDDRRRGRRSNDSRNGRAIVIVVLVAADADRFPTAKDTRATTENGMRDLAFGPIRR